MEEKVTFPALITQTVASISIAFLTVLTGFLCAWPSYTVANFVSNQTVLSHPMSTLEISLLGSVNNIGALVATPFCGYILDSAVRKYGAMLFGLPYVIAWSILSITNYVPLVLAAYGFAGVGSAGQCISTVYISEISQPINVPTAGAQAFHVDENTTGRIFMDSIRGALTSTTVTGYCFGLLISYAIGGHLSYQNVIYVHLSLSILYVVIVALLQDSPVFLLQKGRDQEAAKAVAFYRRVSVTSKEVDAEIEKIRMQLDPQINDILQAKNEAASKQLIKAKGEENTKDLSGWKFLKKSESSQRALAAVIIVMAISICMGSIVIQVYAEPLFKEAVPSMDSNHCSIYLAIDYVVACLACCLLLDRLGRKFLFTSTSIASGVLTLMLGLQLQYHWAPHWVTATLIYAFCFFYDLGASIVPFVLSSEVFLPEVRGFGNSCAMACMWSMSFLTVIVFNPIVEGIGLGFTFCIFSIICFLGAAYGQFCLPETKGLPADAIQLLFLKKRDRNSVI